MHLEPLPHGADLSADRYLAGLDSDRSKRAMRTMLGKIAAVVCRIPSVGGEPLAIVTAHANGRAYKSRLSKVDLSRIPWASITVDHCQRVRATLAAQHKSATVNLAMAALRGVLLAAAVLDEPKRRATRAMRGNSAPAATIEVQDLGLLLAQCESDERPAGARDGALFALFASGLRRSEVAALQHGDYSSAQASVVVLGKGRKHRKVALHPEAVRLLDAWLAVRGRAAGSLLTALDKAGRPTGPLSAQAAYKRVQVRAKAAGVPCSPHSFRAWAITSLLDAGGELSSAAFLAGHSSVATTQRYDRAAERRVRVLVERMRWPGQVAYR